MTPEEAIEEGIPIVKKVAFGFFRSNFSAYTRLAMEVGDLEGHLYETVLFGKYLPMVEKDPDYYDTASFGRSLYSACRRAMLSHVKKHIESQKRGLILKPGAAVELDKKTPEGLSPEIAKPSDQTLLRQAKIAADSLDDLTAKRAVLLLSRERYTSRTQLKKRLGVSHSRFNEVWKKVEAAFAFLSPDKTTPNLFYEPAV